MHTMSVHTFYYACFCQGLYFKAHTVMLCVVCLLFHTHLIMGCIAGRAQSNSYAKQLRQNDLIHCVLPYLVKHLQNDITDGCRDLE